MASYTTSLIIFMAITGVIIKMIQPTSSNINVGPASASLWSYGMIMMATLGIMFSSFAVINKMDTLKTNSVSFVKSLFTQSVPSLLLIGLLTWLIVLNAQYFKNINQGEVATEYSMYSNVSFFLILLQLWIAYDYMQNSMKTSEVMDSYNRRLLSVNYLLTITNSMVILIMNIILKYFSTDG
jgi:hypothetical protein